MSNVDLSICIMLALIREFWHTSEVIGRWESTIVLNTVDVGVQQRPQLGVLCHLDWVSVHSHEETMATVLGQMVPGQMVPGPSGPWAKWSPGQVVPGPNGSRAKWSGPNGPGQMVSGPNGLVSVKAASSPWMQHHIKGGNT